MNNASAINLAPMRDLEVKRFDLMQQINARGTFVVTRACLPHLRESDHAHVLTLSPPLSADPRWLKGHSAYTLSKMGMTMITLGVAADEAEAGIGANCLGRARSSPRRPSRTCSAATRRWPARACPPSSRMRPMRSCSATRASAPATSSSTTRCWPRPASRTSPSYSGTPDADLALDIFVDG